MSDAYECDACGELRSGTPPNIIDVHNTKDGVLSYELCGECGKKLDTFLL